MNTDHEQSPDVPNYLVIEGKVHEYPFESEHSYLIVSFDESSLFDFLDFGDDEYPMNEWKPQDNYLILSVLQHTDNLSNNYKKLFAKLWKKYGILNVITIIKFLKHSEKQDEIILAHNPFITSEENKMWLVDPEELPTLPITYLQRTWNLKGYELRVVSSTTSTDDFDDYYLGRDEHVLHNLAKYMNFTINLINQTNEIGSIFGNISNGAMEYLLERQVDIIIKDVYIKYYGTNRIQFTMPAFYTRKLVILVPKAEKVHVWKVISKCFSTYFWISLLAVFITCAALWYVLRKLHMKFYFSQSNHRPISCFINAVDTWTVLITMVLPWLTRITLTSQRIFLSTCIVFSVVLMTAFQSSLLDVITHPHFHKDIDTLKQLDMSSLQILFSDLNLFDTFESSDLKNLAFKLNYVQDEWAALTQVATDKNVCLLTSDLKAQVYKRRLDQKLHLVAETPKEYFVSYMIPTGSPYASRLHNLLGRMVEAGLVRKWDQQIKREKQSTAASEDNGISMLRLGDLNLVFFLLGVGLTLSFVTFLIENIFILKQ
ncbi:hypothetical protein ANN_05736 [Periplaneta americana]|uniref:Ionotropic receptor n=1 Tax=Periplaneta americana TaxID=6978 RepID=A0ABQ8TDH1_PERAM|nr:hypothetical protein ANN_05736 [Periplaneta americana]